VIAAACRAIVRPARRPPGWRAPGPPPAPRCDVSRLGPRPGEDLCHLAGDWRILQRLDGHRWSLDDLVTAWFAARSVDATPARVADLGCGIGAVLMLLAWRFPAARLIGIEAQAVSVDLARRSLAWNGADDRCEIRLGDLRDPGVLPPAGGFALVAGTPPYLVPGAATESRRIQVAHCHVEHRGGIEAYAAAAAGLLACGGRFVACAGAGQRRRVEQAAAAAGLAIHDSVDVIPRAGKRCLFSVYAMRHAGGGFPARVHPPLIVRDARGRRTEAFRAVRDQMGMPP